MDAIGRIEDSIEGEVLKSVQAMEFADARGVCRVLPWVIADEQRIVMTLIDQEAVMQAAESVITKQLDNYEVQADYIREYIENCEFIPTEPPTITRELTSNDYVIPADVMKGITKLIGGDLDTETRDRYFAQLIKVAKEHEDYWFGDDDADKAAG